MAARPAAADAQYARSVRFPDGACVPAIGLGTWNIGDDPVRRDGEIAALRAGLDAGAALIDTAEMYGEGASERLVGEAIRGRARESLFMVSKVYPHNARRGAMRASCEASLERLGLDYLDLYLLHWRGDVPLAETVACFEELQRAGLIARWGVSNFDVADLEELWRTPGGDRCATNQVLYHLGSRGIEFALLPWMERHGLPTMAYCPLAQAGRISAGLLDNPAVRAVAQRHGATPAQVLLAFLTGRKGVVALPKASSVAHERENVGALSLQLTPDDCALLDDAFPPPTEKMPLDME